MVPTILLQSGGAAGVFVLVFLITIGMAAWTYSDAKRNSSHPAFLWAVVVFLAPLLGILLYLILGRGS
ncbi:PLDc N-terminal domain-containing protein [Haloferax prahovense]|uniref:PLDc N-terminal domain-containing protein n=1 Tax=Haloferax TaxID=2251 RepID=UPI000737D231|nr:PLDc N-terminal domain-containing protein [Haloferax sp. Q22]